MNNLLCVRCKSKKIYEFSLCEVCLNDDYKVFLDAKTDLKVFFNNLMFDLCYTNDIELFRDDPQYYILRKIISGLTEYRNSLESDKKNE